MRIRMDTLGSGILHRRARHLELDRTRDCCVLPRYACVEVALERDPP